MSATHTQALAAEIERQSGFEETDFWAHCPECDLNISVDVSQGAGALRFYEHTGRLPAGTTFDQARLGQVRPSICEGSGAVVADMNAHWNW